MNNAPFFSIITPTYNRAKFITKAIESVLNQSFCDWEYIIIDDGSTDNTSEIIASFDDKRIIYIFQENQERSHARNHGIKLSKGKFICFLDSDDYYLNHHLQTLYDNIINTKIQTDFFYTQSIIIKVGKEREYYPLPTNDENMVRFIWYNHLSMNSTCFYHSITEKIKFPTSINYGEDTYFLTQVALEFPIIPIHEQTAVVLHHQNQSINIIKNNDILEATIQYIDIINNMYELQKSQKHLSKKEKHEKIIQEILNRIRLCLRHNKLYLSFNLFILLISKFEIHYFSIFTQLLIVTIFRVIKDVIKKLYQYLRFNKI
jgi:glycosyltransferase involved in cell wall biosynthesis